MAGRQIRFLWLPLDDVVIGHVTEKGIKGTKFYLGHHVIRMARLNEPGKPCVFLKDSPVVRHLDHVPGSLMNEWMSYSGEHF